MKTGGCLCGSVRYEFAGEPAFVGGCYCKDCQKESGSGHNVIAAVPEAALKMLGGATRNFVAKGGSGKEITRVFCPNCGTTLFSRPQVMPGMLMVRLGTIDDSSGYTRGMNIFCSHARDWDAPAANVTGHARMPG